MLKELAFNGLLFSPLIIFIPLAFLLSCITRLVLYQTGLYHRLWRSAWFEVGLFICYLAFVIYLLGS
ncbi:DUF1656 domain-containing protein [Shewanella morhuae]|uniref:DUF1656 domain-containing protein n=1 Tax=Shewanella morhuae TaxID=365591 RepID=UPI00097038C5|nr:DUF1656 domain-containing protein [Shewanella morhuae]